MVLSSQSGSIRMVALRSCTCQPTPRPASRTVQRPAFCISCKAGSRRTYGSLDGIQGALLVGAGILAVIYPAISSAAVIVLLGWLLIISGVVQGLSLVGARHVPHFWLQLISVILAVLIGCLFLRDPAQGMMTIALLLIVFFMIEGISKVVFALTIRPFPNWGWVLASGLVGILLTLILWANLPVTALWLVGVLLGLQLISVGAAIAYLAWQVRQS